MNFMSEESKNDQTVPNPAYIVVDGGVNSGTLIGRGSFATHDAVNHPKHYTDHPSGVECIRITEHMNFSLGNAVKYIWRADLKGNSIEDLEKAEWYVKNEIARRKKQQGIV